MYLVGIVRGIVELERLMGEDHTLHRLNHNLASSGEISIGSLA